MVRIRAEFDGKVLIPERELQLPTGVPLDLIVENVTESASSSVMDVAGVGADVWAGIDGADYQRGEREGW